MNAEAMARIAVRVLAIWLAVSAVAEMSRVVSVDTHSVDYAAIIGIYLVLVATYCGAAVALWRWSPAVARRIVADAPMAESNAPANSAAVLGQVAIGVLGLFMLSSAIPESLWLFVAFLASRVMGPSPLAGQPSYDAQMGLYTVGGVANAASVCARVVLGLLLLLRARAAAALILRDTTTARDRRAAQQEDAPDEARKEQG